MPLSCMRRAETAFFQPDGNRACTGYGVLQESAMALRTLSSFVVAVIFLAGCDISQTKPETALRAGTPSDTVQPTPGDRSIRLFGPGVSRQKQTRV